MFSSKLFYTPCMVVSEKLTQKRFLTYLAAKTESRIFSSHSLNIFEKMVENSPMDLAIVHENGERWEEHGEAGPVIRKDFTVCTALYNCFSSIKSVPLCY